VAVGTAGDVEVAAAATRVDLTGMTVMPTIVDAHTHLSTTREALLDDLERRAYHGVGMALSLGHDTEDVPLEVRGEVFAGAARYRSAGRGITSPEPGRTEASHWVTTEEEARQAVRDEAAREVDIIKIWVDDRNGRYEKLSPELYGAIIDEAHQNGLRVTAHIFALEDAKGLLRAGIDAFAHGVRDQDIDEEFIELQIELLMEAGRFAEVRELLQRVLVENPNAFEQFPAINPRSRAGSKDVILSLVLADVLFPLAATAA